MSSAHQYYVNQYKCKQHNPTNNNNNCSSQLDLPLVGVYELSELQVGSSAELSVLHNRESCRDLFLSLLTEFNNTIYYNQLQFNDEAQLVLAIVRIQQKIVNFIEKDLLPINYPWFSEFFVLKLVEFCWAGVDPSLFNNGLAVLPSNQLTFASRISPNLNLNKSAGLNAAKANFKPNSFRNNLFDNNKQQVSNKPSWASLARLKSLDNRINPANIPSSTKTNNDISHNYKEKKSSINNSLANKDLVSLLSLFDGHFPYVESFFALFMISSCPQQLLTAIQHYLIYQATQLSQIQNQLNGNSIQLQRTFDSRILKLELLGKFLGFSCHFKQLHAQSSQFSAILDNYNNIYNHNHLHNLVLPQFDVNSVIMRAEEKNELLIILPFLSQYLQWLEYDQLQSNSNYFKQTFQLLNNIYIDKLNALQQISAGNVSNACEEGVLYILLTLEDLFSGLQLSLQSTGNSPPNINPSSKNELNIDNLLPLSIARLSAHKALCSKCASNSPANNSSLPANSSIPHSLKRKIKPNAVITSREEEKRSPQQSLLAAFTKQNPHYSLILNNLIEFLTQAAIDWLHDHNSLQTILEQIHQAAGFNTILTHSVLTQAVDKKIKEFLLNHSSLAVVSLVSPSVHSELVTEFTLLTIHKAYSNLITAHKDKINYSIQTAANKFSSKHAAKHS
jgi:hypothetical protein